MRSAATVVFLFSSWFSIISTTITPVAGSNNYTPNVILVISQTDVQADCTIRPSVTVNGTSPGPELRFKEGEKVWIRVINSLTEHNSTIHFHGLSQFGSPFADGTDKTAQFAIVSNGGYFDYEFHLQHGIAGNYPRKISIYHAHVGNQLSTAHGAFIVEDDTIPPYSYDDEFTLLMNDYYHAVDEEIESDLRSTPFKWVGEPQSLLVNGNALGTCDPSTAKYGCTSDCHHHTVLVKPETTYRVRVIGITSLSFLYFAFEGHSELEVIEVDGGYVKSALTDHIEIHSGQRYSFLLKTKSEAELKALNGQRDFWGHIQSRWRPARVHGAFVMRYAHDILDLNLESSLVSRTVTPDLPAFQKLVPLPDEGVPWLLEIFEPLDPKERAPLASEVNRRIIISGQQLKSPSGTIKWFVNGRSHVETKPDLPFLVRAYTTGLKPDYVAASKNNGFDPSLGAYPVKLGEVIEMVFLNLASTSNVSEAHPWHLHGQAAYVVGQATGVFSEKELAKQEARRNHQPIARDTQIVFAGQGATYSNTTVPTGTQTGWMVLRMKAETPGAFLLHCHIQPHAFMGMGAVILIGMENLPPLPQNFLKKYM
ncbi:Cupredoxin [Melampsora americana]|nr:Cupredoxin [Melampsora americana]